MRTINQLSKVFGLIVAAALLAGCATQERQSQIAATRPVVAPPMPGVSVMRSAVAAAMSAEVGAVRSNAVIMLKWNKPQDSSVMSYRIYDADSDKLLLSVDAAYANCTMRGFRDGEPRRFYATAMNEVGIEGDASNTATGLASSTVPWTVPHKEVYARRFSWKCVRGVTNILQSSSNLTTWTAASRFRGTNGTAVVTLTNQLPFHRVLVQNATNVPPMTLTQSVAFVRLTWSNSPATALYKRMDARTESFIPIHTNAGSGLVSLILPASADQYRVMRW